MSNRSLLLVTTVCLLAPNASGQSVEVSFSRDIQPLLAKRCFACHGPAEHEAGLGLHTFDMATARLESGDTAVVPGQPERSMLLRRVTSADESLRMPPEGEALSESEVERLTLWIQQGAEYEPHWSFVTPQRPQLPVVSEPTLVRNAIDHFILARLNAIGLSLSPPADDFTLLRRLYLDLTGLLPPVDVADAFAHGGLSYEDVVSRLLESPHFGERWGRHWLDLARYADTFGYERDDVRPNAWRYRDWVVRSFNRNQPYDRFLVDQLAGDLYDSPTLDQQIATGLHRMNIKNNESGINKEDYRNREMVDRVNTTSTAMLGLTLGCCQCHDHKYDSLSQTDYYQLYAFFNNIEIKDEDIEGTSEERARYETAKAALDTQRKRLEERKKLIGELRGQRSFADRSQYASGRSDQIVDLLELTGELAAAVRSPQQHQDQLAMLWESLPGRADDTEKALRQLSVQKRHLPKPYIMMLAEAKENRRPTHVLTRGDFKQKGEQIHPATPDVLPPLSVRGATPDRLDLARWLVQSDNPLTARVAVNHIWMHLFGRGIVTSADDFGTQGEPPSHPLLLDWLAVEFMESGWDRKQLIRTIVSSATYRQSSRIASFQRPEHQQAMGPDNPLFARQSRHRVESEIVRDIFLDASGLLHREVGGPTIHPLIPSAVADLGYKYRTRWIVSEKPHRYRRGLYIHFKRTNPYPTLLMFDGPESNVCQAMRNRSNTPLQALATLNDPVFMECARTLGHQLATSKPTESDSERTAWLFRRCLSRFPEPSETEAILQLLESQRSWYRHHPGEADSLVGEDLSANVSSHEVAAWTAVARAIVNLDEFVTRE